MSVKIENPLVSMFILPEHREMILEHQAEKKLVTRPVLEEDELTEISYLIQDSIHNDYAVTVHWWKSTKGNLGVIESAWGWVQKIDFNYRQIKLVNDEDFWWIDFQKIIAVYGP